MRYDEEENPKKPHPVRSEKKKGAVPVEADDDGHDRHRHA